jgi:hypothetical protein
MTATKKLNREYWLRSDGAFCRVTRIGNSFGYIRNTSMRRGAGVNDARVTRIVFDFVETSTGASVGTSTTVALVGVGAA